MEQARLVLKERFGHDSFREGQEQVLQRLLVNNENVLSIAPAAEDRPLTFQVAALCLEGLTLVVSPLLSLMKEQVGTLRELKVEAASIGSDSTIEDLNETWSRAGNGELKVLYITPERLTNEGFLSKIVEQDVALLVIEEAQAVFDSGRSFRPEYCKLPQFATDIEAERILCLASIATPATIAELCAPSPNGFSIDTEKGVFRSGMNRENISLIVHQAPGLKDKIRSLVDFLKKLDGGAAIIYVTTPRHVRERTGELEQHGFQEVMSCHGKMSREDKDSVRDKFNAEGGIVVATTAFGTGVYRRDIRAIVHFDPPMTLEKYSEQIERVGRDGKPADCLLLHSYGDWNFLEGLISRESLSQDTIEQWLKAVFKSVRTDNTLSFSLDEQAEEFCIERNVLTSLYAKLGTDYGLLSLTSFYSTYKIKPLLSDHNSFEAIREDSSDAAEAIRSKWKYLGPRSGYEIDVSAAAADSPAKGLTRREISRKLHDWEIQKRCELNVGGIVNRYLASDPPWKSQKELTGISCELWSAVSQQVGTNLERLDKVQSYTKSCNCFNRFLAEHFGDSNSAKCGRCSICNKSRGIWLPPSPRSPTKREPWSPDASPAKKMRWTQTPPVQSEVGK